MTPTSPVTLSRRLDTAINFARNASLHYGPNRAVEISQAAFDDIIIGTLVEARDDASRAVTETPEGLTEPEPWWFGPKVLPEATDQPAERIAARVDQLRALRSSSMPDAWNEAIHAVIDVCNGTPWQDALDRGRRNLRLAHKEEHGG